MKKLLVLVGLLSLLFASCATGEISDKYIVKFDDSIPEEETARLVTERIGNIIEYNGIPINWKRTDFKYYQIPAGDTLLVCNVDSFLINNPRVTVRGEGFQFRYNFQKKKNYYFYLSEKDGKYGLEIYSWDYGEKMSFNKKNLVGFVPFVNNVGKNNNRKVLN